MVLFTHLYLSVAAGLSRNTTSALQVVNVFVKQTPAFCVLTRFFPDRWRFLAFFQIILSSASSSLSEIDEDMRLLHQMKFQPKWFQAFDSD